jgi:hypothetical protein
LPLLLLLLDRWLVQRLLRCVLVLRRRRPRICTVVPWMRGGSLHVATAW